jgi:hypothetical protein
MLVHTLEDALTWGEYRPWRCQRGGSQTDPECRAHASQDGYIERIFI